MAKKPPKKKPRKGAVTVRPQVTTKDRDISKSLLKALSTPELQKEAIAAFLELLEKRSERTVLWYVARFVGNPGTVETDRNKQAASITFNFAGAQMVGPPVFDAPTTPSLQE